jgi:two-component system sensor histidine kinase YesM
MMRYNLRPENIVPLRDELAQVEDYLAIMQQRFGSLFSYEVEVLDTGVLDEQFCKMALQPLVENVIKHGFRNINHSGIICIAIGRQQNCYYCMIQDNGCGIPREKLDSLLSAIKNTTASDEALLAVPHHGILNVYTRLLMHFGNLLEFRLASREDAGTSITILIETDSST